MKKMKKILILKYYENYVMKMQEKKKCIWSIKLIIKLKWQNY